MNNYRTKSAIAVQVVTIILICFLVAVISKVSLGINWDTVKLLPSVISIYTALHLIFVRWLWRKSWFSGWFVIIPDLQGTWRGQIRSCWSKENDSQESTTVEAYLVIRQTLRTIKVRVFTAESTSISRSAAIHIDEENGLKSLDYSYFNKPGTDFRDRSELHFGAASIEISLKPERTLKGDYWADRRTRGSMDFEFASSDLVERFPTKGTD